MCALDRVQEVVASSGFGFRSAASLALVSLMSYESRVNEWKDEETEELVVNFQEHFSLSLLRADYEKTEFCC